MTDDPEQRLKFLFFLLPLLQRQESGKGEKKKEWRWVRGKWKNSTPKAGCKKRYSSEKQIRFFLSFLMNFTSLNLMVRENQIVLRLIHPRISINSLWLWVREWKGKRRNLKEWILEDKMSSTWYANFLLFHSFRHSLPFSLWNLSAFNSCHSHPNTMFCCLFNDLLGMYGTKMVGMERRIPVQLLMQKEERCGREERTLPQYLPPSLQGSVTGLNNHFEKSLKRHEETS